MIGFSVSPGVDIYVKYDSHYPIKSNYPLENDYKGLGFMNTVLLISASGFLSWGEKQISSGYISYINYIFFILCAILCSLLFLISQILEFSRLSSSIQDGIKSSYFLCIVGLHMTHVTVGVILLISSVILILKSK